MMNMQSGAAHDAQVLAPKIASGMIFVPSIGGISHDFNEDTAEEDIILGCQVVAAAVDAHSSGRGGKMLTLMPDTSEE